MVHCGYWLIKPALLPQASCIPKKADSTHPFCLWVVHIDAPMEATSKNNGCEFIKVRGHNQVHI